jgi:DNA topoisomerase VI subunit A
MRTFSRRACGDSKAVEAGTARLERVLRQRFNLPWTRPGETLTALGIEKFPWPVLIRAKLCLAGGGEIDARPYFGLPPEMAMEISVTGPVPYLLIIENLASFNRHAREISDGGVLVYSGGFPSRATLSLIRRLDITLPAAVPFFHWGDADHHGRLILDHIASAIGRPLHPHLMDRPDGEEQEEIDPQSPIAQTTMM